MTSLGFVCWLAGRHPRPGLRVRGPAPDDCRRMIPGRQDRRAWTTVRPRPGTGNLIFRSGNPDAAAPGGRPGEPGPQRAAAVACRPDATWSGRGRSPADIAPYNRAFPPPEIGRAHV